MTIDDLMTNMTEVELRCMFFWGANPQSISWLARRRTNLQSLKLLPQHAAKTSHVSSQGPSVDCSFTLGNVHLSQWASTRPWLQPGCCRRPAEEDFSQRHHCWRSQGLGLWVASCSMHHNAEGLEFFRCRCFDIQIIYIYIRIYNIIYIYLFYLSCSTFRNACQVYLCVVWHAQQESDDQVPGRRPFEAPVRLQAGFLCCGARWQRAPFWKGTWWTLYHFSIQFSPRASANFWTTTWGSSAAFFLLCQSNRHKLVHCSHATFQPVWHLLNSSKYCCRTEIFRIRICWFSGQFLPHVVCTDLDMGRPLLFKYLAMIELYPFWNAFPLARH